MTAAVAQLSGLSELDTQSKLVVTAAVLVGLAVAWIAVEAASERLRDTVSDRTVESVEALLFTLLVGTTTGLLGVLWSAFGPIQDRLGELLQRQDLGVNIVVSVLMFATAYGVTRIVRRLINRSEVARVSTDHRREVAYHVVQVTIYTIALLSVLAVWRVNVGNLLLGAGVLGVVLGLAARETLGAVLAGFVLLFAKPFEVGDWVEISGQEGIVEDITIVNTRLRTFDDEQVMIPNDQVTGEEIINRTREGRLRGTVEVGVDYETDLDEAVAVAESAMESIEEVLANPAPRAVGKRFDDSAVVLELRYWVGGPSAEKMWTARTAVVTAVRDAYDDAGIDIPFPQRTLGAREAVAVAADRRPGADADVAATDGGAEDETGDATDRRAADDPADGG